MRNAASGEGERMKSGIYLGKESIAIREIPIPEVGDNDVLSIQVFAEQMLQFFPMARIPGIK